MQVLVRMKFGSHLYGTNTENSDTDYKTVFLPSVESLLTCTTKHAFSNSTGNSHSKNTNQDTDDDYYSLHKFIEMAKAGDAVALDMLHCEYPEQTSELWENIRANRYLFYTKNMKSYIGYVKQQAAKYGIKGSRMNSLKEAIDSLVGDGDVASIAESLHLDEYVFITHVKDRWSKPEDAPKPYYSVLGKKYQFTNKIRYVREQLQKTYDTYGERARLAAENKGVDWKAVHHALRVSYQLEGIYKYGDFSYPLPQTDYLMSVKKGEIDFNQVSAELTRVSDEVKELAERSNMREKVDSEYWNDMIYRAYTIFK